MLCMLFLSVPLVDVDDFREGRENPPNSYNVMGLMAN